VILFLKKVITNDKKNYKFAIKINEFYQNKNNARYKLHIVINDS